MKNFIMFFLFLPFFVTAQITPTTATVTDSSVIFWDVPAEIPLSVFGVTDCDDLSGCFPSAVGDVDSLAASCLIYYHIGKPDCLYNDIDLDCCRNAQLQTPAFDNNEQLADYMHALIPLLGCGNTPLQYRVINIY